MSQTQITIVQIMRTANGIIRITGDCPTFVLPSADRDGTIAALKAAGFQAIDSIVAALDQSADPSS